MVCFFFLFYFVLFPGEISESKEYVEHMASCLLVQDKQAMKLYVVFLVVLASFQMLAGVLLKTQNLKNGPRLSEGCFIMILLCALLYLIQDFLCK